MKKLAAIAAIALIGTPAFAADPPPAPAPVYNWTGWYAGVNAGASFGNVKTDFNVAPVTAQFLTTPFSVPGFVASDTLYPGGFVGGGQIGYNWQFSPIWVVGLEADFQGADEKDSATLTNPFNFIVLTNPNDQRGPRFSVSGATIRDYQAKIRSAQCVCALVMCGGMGRYLAM